MSGVLDALNLTLERAIVGAGIDLLPFHKFVFCNQFLKLLVGDKIVFLAILLLPARCAGGRGNRELKVMAFAEQVVYQGRFARPAWGTENQYHN